MEICEFQLAGFLEEQESYKQKLLAKNDELEILKQESESEIRRLLSKGLESDEKMMNLANSVTELSAVVEVSVDIVLFLELNRRGFFIILVLFTMVEPTEGKV